MGVNASGARTSEDARVYTLVMRLGPIVFLSSWNRDRESVLFRSKRTGGIRSNCAWRIVGSIKVDLYHSIHDRLGF